MKVLIAVASNEKYAPMLRGLLRSVADAGAFSKADLGVFDLGLSQETLSWLAQYKPAVRTPGWDLPVNPQLQASSDHFRALTVRPFLPDYFPGYDVYLWLDTDTWVQNKLALDWFVGAAAQGSMGLVPYIDRSYPYREDIHIWRHERIKVYFGEEAAQGIYRNAYFNAGIFSLPANAPHWAAWKKYFKQGLEATQGLRLCDQSALNYAIWKDGLAVYPLPAKCNWACHVAMPVFDAKSEKFCDPLIPYEPLFIIHMGGDSKKARVNSTTKDGKTIDRSLGYMGMDNG